MSKFSTSAATLNLSSGRIPSCPPAHPEELDGFRSATGQAQLGTALADMAPVPVPYTNAEQALPREHFVAQLRREMRRADRSESPLSIAVFRLPHGRRTEDARALCRRLIDIKRETDIVGLLEPGVVGVICTDTGKEGVQTFIRKVGTASAGQSLTVELSTYPDQVLDIVGKPGTAPRPAIASLFIRDMPESRGAYFLKRPFDVIGALTGLILLSPVMIATALAVKLSSPGPIIFRQTRLGSDGRPFAFYKFRSMVINVDDRIHREYVASLIKGESDTVEQFGDAGLRFKMKADPRITRVGRFIRKTSLDELPQLFNVLKGDMSLVGPRPPLPYEAENYRSWHLRRVLGARPGITGLWQVEGRSRVNFDEMVRMDLRYSNNCSLFNDLSLLIRTFRVVFKGIGGG